MEVPSIDLNFVALIIPELAVIAVPTCNVLEIVVIPEIVTPAPILTPEPTIRSLPIVTLLGRPIWTSWPSALVSI